jgi:iron-sulfur cluster repair protein YtfE (RIC family)
MDFFDILKKDHRKVSDLFKQIEKLDEDETQKCEQLFAQLKSNLEAHTQLEETIVYPALQEKEETREIILESREEHEVVKTLLQELDQDSDGDEVWDAKLTVLKENVEHHVEEEEGEMFKKAKKALSKEEIRRITDQVMEQKRSTSTDEELEEANVKGR